MSNDPAPLMDPYGAVLGRGRIRVTRAGWITVAVAIIAMASVWQPSIAGAARHASAARPTGSESPPRGGYFALRPVSQRGSLPFDGRCAQRVHRSGWDPRSDDAKRNHVKPNPAAVHASFAARPRARQGAYNGHWDDWLLPRVDGQFTGTTDEIIQWAACKWGLPDDMLRAIAARESTWYQYETYEAGRCVAHFGCGDMLSANTAASRLYCDAIARFGYDYQGDFGTGICPETFSIAGVKSWQDPAWGAYPGNQNGTFPFARDSTAFAFDYLGSQLRGCFEGWEYWLRNTGTKDYAAGDIWGCVGAWYAGAWHTTGANDYIARVQDAMRSFVWLAADWPNNRPGCDQQYGCPGPDTLPLGPGETES